MTNTIRTISPTDIADYLRLEQCHKFLALRLHDRQDTKAFYQFLDQQGLKLESSSPYLLQSGQIFETELYTLLQKNYATENFKTFDNDYAGALERLSQLMAGLGAGAAPLMLYQFPLNLIQADWNVSGIADFIRLEKRVDGSLHFLIADVKRSARVRVEHRIQVAFYKRMLQASLNQRGITSQVGTAIIYRGQPELLKQLANPARLISREERLRLERETLAAQTWFGFDPGTAFLEEIAHDQPYQVIINKLVFDSEALARQLAQSHPDDTSVPYHLESKCDSCRYSQFCLNQAAKTDDLSVLPHLTLLQKKDLQATGIANTAGLANLKSLYRKGDLLADGTIATKYAYIVRPGQEETIKKLQKYPRTGAHLDVLINRAHLHRRVVKGEPYNSLSLIGDQRQSSLPHVAPATAEEPAHHPNLVYIFLDIQQDYVTGQAYLLGARLVGYNAGEIAKTQSVVHLAPAPVETIEQERDLLLGWLQQVLTTLFEVATPNAANKYEVPIHLVFYDHYQKANVLNMLSRHQSEILGTTGLYDLITQPASFDSPNVSFLQDEIAEFKNYPMLCQSLAIVANYLKFDWSTPENFSEVFKKGVFDYNRKIVLPDTGEVEWYAARARFNSDIPLEYAYLVWGRLEPEKDLKAYYSAGLSATVLESFQARRLEALQTIAGQFPGNKLTNKTSYNLNQLLTPPAQLPSLARALVEFATIERLTELNDWRSLRNLNAERRALLGVTLKVKYREAAQVAAIAALNQQSLQKAELLAYYEQACDQALLALNPAATDDEIKKNRKEKITKEQKAETKWEMWGKVFRLDIDLQDINAELTELLNLSDLQKDESCLLYPRQVVDTRLPRDKQTRNNPTPKQMLYGMHGTIKEINLSEGWLDFELSDPNRRHGEANFIFSVIRPEPFKEQTYTLETNPNDYYGGWCMQVVKELEKLVAEPAKHPYAFSTLYRHLEQASPAASNQPNPWLFATAQQKFMTGLLAMHQAEALHAFDTPQQEYIGGYGREPVLLVQGPPGTGKSYSTAFAVFARLQGAMATGQPYRVQLSCKTHAATDVLIAKMLEVQNLLKELSQQQPAIFARYFEPRLLEVELLRYLARQAAPAGIRTILKKSEDDTDVASPVKAFQLLTDNKYYIYATTPGSVRSIYQNELSLTGNDKRFKWFERKFIECLVLDEASQMNLPEAIMGSLPLKPDGQLIVVGDHRQMPPIVKHDWQAERGRIFEQHRTYESLFDALRSLATPPPMVKLEQSFRLHTVMAEFLRRSIYVKDGVNYYSKLVHKLQELPLSDEFSRAVLNPAYPIVIISHTESHSQNRNLFEQSLVARLLNQLHTAGFSGFSGGGKGLSMGVVVPHRAQRVDLYTALPYLTRQNAQNKPETSGVDTVEKYQGDERDIIILSATESDRDYLYQSGKFIFDPCRLTVALSRAKRKLIVIASQAIFDYFSPDDEVFQNALLWKGLLDACPDQLFQASATDQSSNQSNDQSGSSGFEYSLTVWGMPA